MRTKLQTNHLVAQGKIKINHGICSTMHNIHPLKIVYFEFTSVATKSDWFQGWPLQDINKTVCKSFLGIFSSLLRNAEGFLLGFLFCHFHFTLNLQFWETLSRLSCEIFFNPGNSCTLSATEPCSTVQSCHRPLSGLVARTF